MPLSLVAAELVQIESMLNDNRESYYLYEQEVTQGGHPLAPPCLRRSGYAQAGVPEGFHPSGLPKRGEGGYQPW